MLGTDVTAEGFRAAGNSMVVCVGRRKSYQLPGV